MTETVPFRTVVVLCTCALPLVAAAQPAAAQAVTLVCQSTQGERAFCSADTSRGVTLKRQLGDAPCEGNWGSDEGGIGFALDMGMLMEIRPEGVREE